MEGMPDARDASHVLLSPRRVAEEYVDQLVALDPVEGTYLGDAASHSRLPDYSSDGRQQLTDLAGETLARLAEAEAVPGSLDDPAEQGCARLLRERLSAQRAMHESGETLRDVSNVFSPVHRVRMAFTLAPTETEEDWRAVASRLTAVPACLAGYRSSLAEGLRRSLPGGPRQVTAMIRQLDEWIGVDGGWFARFAAAGPEPLRRDLDTAVELANGALGDLRTWLSDTYAPSVAGTPDVVGRDRYLLASRYWNGNDLDFAEAYEYGWSEFHRLLDEMRVEAEAILPGAESPWAVTRHLDINGQGVDGAEPTREWLQRLMEEAIGQLDGTHFDIPEPVKQVESCLAPAGSAPAPYYTAPARDFSRPGRTWLPHVGRDRFPAHEFVSTWYHEGVPGHHLQLAQWVHAASRLSRYQTGVGMVSANAEGWALYAERLMDELGFLDDHEHRLGYLDAQMLRSIRVIVDLGMHLRLPIPDHSPFHAGETWTPELAEQFLLAHQGRHPDVIRSEIIRYQGAPGQAIGYKLGERVWLRGREAARRARGADFDLRAWHMAALNLGSLGLDDLEERLATL
ncbi:DUF885 domain-containing protein [Polymorphospora rubra]|uniref:DUF885 domain-containing protein n=2 Tax=Polymorphospora rubra TaxID=338584 RepID=A0A810N6W3_9ACTN|nr:hypothetical protein Prubr_63330 [Polymorphospora rubra]